MIGQKVHQYQIVEKLGEGGMGVVYKARDTKLDRFVALKFLPRHLRQAEEERRRFIHEAKAASALDHPNICTIHEIGETDDGQMFIAMSYYEGSHVREKISQGPLPLDEALNIAMAVCEGLARAHEEDIVHRDIKPENIMITVRGEVKLVDFGLAKLAGRSVLTKEGTTLGTMAYMAPEQAQGAEMDHRTDIWALGAVLYEMVSGQQPFKGEYEQVVAYSILNEEAEPLTALRTGVPMELERIVNKTLEKDRELRYQSAADLLSDLKKLTKDLESGLSASGQRPAAPPKEKRKFTRLAIPAAAILILAVAFLLLRPIFQEAPLVSSPKPIVVMPFENQTGDESFDYLRTAIPNLLITNLEQSKYLSVVTWERMQDVLKSMGKTHLELVDINKEAGFDLCQSEGVNAIVLGSFTRAGETFATDIKVLDVNSKRLLKSANATGEGVGSVIRDQIDQLSEAISQSALIPFPAAKPETFNLAEVTTQSMEAYRFYLEGVKNYHQFFQGAGIGNLTKAVELDSAFAMAHYFLARLHSALGNRTARDDAIRKAMKYAVGSTAREALFIEMDYAQMIEMDEDKALQLNEELVQRFPKEKRAFHFLGIKYTRDSRIRDAIAVYEQVTELDSTWGPGYNQIGYSYASVGEFDKAEKALRKYAKLAPNEPNPYDSLGEVYQMMGRLDDAILNFKRVLEIVTDWLNVIQLARIYA
ncbi:MAG: protein kinase, partial [bacterium]